MVGNFKKNWFVLSLLAVMLTAGGAWAQFSVPGDYATIQAAIDAAPPGATINIAAGTYTQNFVINKQLSLVGAGSGSDPLTNTIITQTTAGAGDTRVGIAQISASGALGTPILLQDLRLEPVGMAGVSVGRFTESTGTVVDYVTLDNVQVIGTNTSPSTEQERGLYVDNTSTLTNLVVADCAFDNLTYGWYFQKAVSADASTVQYVQVTGSTFNHNNHKGLYVEKLSDASFTDCVFDANGFDSSVLPSYFSPWSCGVDVNLKAGTYANIAFSTCAITGNATDESKEGTGASIKARDDGTTYGPFPASLDNVDLVGCTITGNERGLRFGEPGKLNASPTNVTVEDCVLLGNTQQYSGSDGSAYGDLLNVTAPGNVIDASPNWWGDVDPTDQIDGEVAWFPCYTDGTMTVLNYPPVHNVDQDTYFATIGAALADANAGDMITVADGIYNPVGSLVINESLTLSGESEAGVIINIPAPYAYGMSVAAADVLLENFTLVCNVANEAYPIHASGTSNPPGGFDNLTIRNATVSGTHLRAGIDIHGYNNVILTNVTSKDATGGNGIQLTGVVGATVSGATTSDNEWGSLAVYCSGPTYLNRGSSNVTIDGASCSFGEGVVFTEDQFGLVSTNTVVTGYGYNVRNFNFRAGAEGFTYFQDTEANAIAHALTLDAIVPGSWITTIGGGTQIVADGMSLRFAIENALSGDEIQVRTGTYLETGQLLADKDLEIVGDVATRPIIMTDTSTSNSGDARGWFLQTAGTHLELRNLVLDGTGQNIYQGLRTTGSGVMDNCLVKNITFPGYAGTAIAAFGAGNWAVTNNTFENIGRIGFLAFGSGLTASSFSGNTYTGKGPGDWLDYAADISAGAVLTVENNTITACQGVASSDGSTSAGLLVSTYFAPGTTATINDNVLTGNTTGVAVGYDASDASTVSGQGNNISGNDSNGVTNTGAGPIDFRNNWWGYVTGPFHPADNPLGEGNEVSDNVLFDPWTGGASASVTATSGPISCSGSKVLTFNYVPTLTTPDIFLFDATVRATSEVSFGTITNEDLFNGTGYFYVVDNVDGSKTITAATLATGGDPYEAGNGDHAMFSIEFLGATEGTATITVEDFTLRDPTNATILVNMPSTTIEVDCTAPLAVTGVTAAPGHNKVDVSWTHAGADVDHFEVFSGLWYAGTVGTSAYPEYDDLANDVIPTAPSNYATAVASNEWDLLVGDATNTLTETWPNATQRGVYYYTVFAVDAAGNASPAPAGLDRSTNYWLGDVVINGMVNVPDMNTLGAAFGTSNGVGAYNAYVDVGPTDDFSRLGIPNTDSKINFEDLMIFSLNFGVVSAAKDKAPVSKTVDLAWVSYDNGDMALRLVNGSGLKGLNVRAGLPVGQVEAGQLLDDQSEVTFLMNVGENLDVSVAVMGVNQGFEGTGDLFIVRSGSGISMDDLHITARATDNSDLEVNLDMTSGTLTPRVFNLNANYPNPFNPMTKISFSLPEAQNVRLNVYSLDGRKVATLLNETRGAGLHEVVWTGRNDDGQSVASGLYFYRIDAGPYSQVRKMTLMK